MKSNNLKKSVIALTLLVAVSSVGFGTAYGYGGGGGGTRSKETICHNGNTITVAKSAVAAHLKHGDTKGACPVVTTAKKPLVLGASDSKVEKTVKFTPILTSLSLILTNIQTGNDDGDISDEDAGALRTQLASVISALMLLFK